jgi:hypothetical protein
MKSMSAILLSTSAALAAATVAAQGAAAQDTPLRTVPGMGCDPMNQVMSSGPLLVAMAIGWALTALLAIAAIYALFALGHYLLRRSRQFLPPSEESARAFRDTRAAAPT